MRQGVFMVPTCNAFAYLHLVMDKLQLGTELGQM